MKDVKTWLSVAVLLLCSLGAVASESPKGRQVICPECRLTAMLALRSALNEARSEYDLALARASTFEDQEERGELQEEAWEDYRDAYRLAKRQHTARLAICLELAECRYDPEIDPENFLTPDEIVMQPNPYFPMIPGRLYRYRGITDEGEEELIEVQFTRMTREILGVTCIVARDTVWVEGDVVEDTWDWYAQDREGNVWYFGELTVEFEDGEILGLEGSFEAGVDGGKPGLIMEAHPMPGDAYRQEMFLGEAEDWAKVLALGQSVTVAYGTFTDCVLTANFNPTGEDPFLAEDKYYAPGIGFVLETKPNGERVELIAIEEVPVEEMGE